MNVVARVELAHEPDFVLGRLTVSPSRRELVRDDGEREVIEHRVMQVLVALSRAEGNIVTRDELTMSCWDGRVVGEDSIHRVLSLLRKVSNGIGTGSFEVETITKIGYRLTSADGVARLATVPPAGRSPSASDRLHRPWRGKLPIVLIAVTLTVAAAFAAWAYFRRDAVPVVAVESADSSPPSQRLARDLFVKLGTLPQVGSGQWQLVEAKPGGFGASLIFRASATASRAESQANLMLLRPNDGSLLWSREFSFPAGRENDLRQHLALTAGRVLACAFEARQQGGLPPNLLRLFLTGCADLAETSNEDPEKTAGLMRAIVAQRPGFVPAWARLLMIDSNALQLATNESRDEAGARRTLQLDVGRARAIAPSLPEIKLAQLELLPPNDYAASFAMVHALKAQAPERPEVWLAEANVLTRVGEMVEAAESARRAALLDPLSPAALSDWISTLAWGGATDAAKQELERAERLWDGTGALRDAQFAFHLRYGDPRIAQRLTSTSGYVGNGTDPYLRARLDPSATNIDRMVRFLQRIKAEGRPQSWGYAVQALGEYHQTDEALEWLLEKPPELIASASYILFRPALAEVRRDIRFMRVAKRIGLLEFWQKSGRWPDFCQESDLPYNCRQEAARLQSIPAPAS